MLKTNVENNNVVDYNNINVSGLRKIAKAYNISGRWDMKKSELIEAIATAKGDLDMEEKRKAKDYLENKEVGLIVAVKNGDKTFSAKVTRYNPDGTIEVTTRCGTVHSVEKQQILWVKTGARWPKFVFEAFRANGNDTDLRA